MKRSIVWRELYRTNDPSLAHMLATCIEGMEFDVRVHDALGRVLDGTQERATGEFVDPSQPRPLFKRPFVIDVREEDWAALRDVLTELIAEQTEFDEKLEAQRQRAARVMQVLLLSLVTLAASFVGGAALKQCEAPRP